jgi:hypothetical protein
MNSVIVFLPSEIRFPEVEDRIHSTLGIVSVREGATLTLDGRRIYYRIDRDIEQHYEREELALVATGIGPWQALVLSYSDLDLVNVVACSIVSHWASFVDDEHNPIQTGDEFLRLLAEGSESDWRAGGLR